VITTHLIVANYVFGAGHDCDQLAPMPNAEQAAFGRHPMNVVADKGYLSVEKFWTWRGFLPLL
jgi:hypothetical protein